MTDCPAPLERSSRISRRPDLLASDLKGETVMLDVERGCYFGLDDIASDLWSRLESPIRVEELCAQLQEGYEVDPATCQRDVLALLTRMQASGLLCPCPEPA